MGEWEISEDASYEDASLSLFLARGSLDLRVILQFARSENGSEKFQQFLFRKKYHIFFIRVLDRKKNIFFRTVLGSGRKMNFAQTVERPYRLNG